MFSFLPFLLRQVRAEENQAKVFMERTVSFSNSSQFFVVFCFLLFSLLPFGLEHGDPRFLQLGGIKIDQVFGLETSFPRCFFHFYFLNFYLFFNFFCYLTSNLILVGRSILYLPTGYVNGLICIHDLNVVVPNLYMNFL